MCSLHLLLFCGFEELSIRHLCLGDIVFFCLCRICVNLLKKLLWADSTIGVWIYIHLLALLLLCLLCSEWTRKFRIDKPGSSEFTYCLAQIRKFRVWQTVNFICCVLVKICRYAYSPPLGDIKVLSWGPGLVTVLQFNYSQLYSFMRTYS